MSYSTAVWEKKPQRPYYNLYSSHATQQRWAESEKMTPKLDPKTPNPALCPSLPCFYIHFRYTIPFIPNPDSSFSQKFKSGSEKCSRTPNPTLCPSLLHSRDRHGSGVQLYFFGAGFEFLGKRRIQIRYEWYRYGV